MVFEGKKLIIEDFNELVFEPTKLKIEKILNPGDPFNSFEIVGNPNYFVKVRKYTVKKDKSVPFVRLKTYDKNGNLLGIRLIEEFILGDLDITHIFMNLFSLNEKSNIKPVKVKDSNLIAIPGEVVNLKKSYLLSNEIKDYLEKLVTKNNKICLS